MSNVHTLTTGAIQETGPNEALIDALKNLLSMAESGQLQSYIGSGFTVDGLRVSTWCDFHDDVYQMLGTLDWLKFEYVQRRTE